MLPPRIRKTTYSPLCSVKINPLIKKHTLAAVLSGLICLQAGIACAQETPAAAAGGNPEFFSTQDKLFRVLRNGDTLSFSAQLYGGISSFDALNPFKILVFSEAFQKIYYLDHRLTMLSETLSLSALGFGDVSCVCASAYGGFWVFDRWQQRLTRVNAQGQTIAASEAFPVLDLKNVLPCSIREKGDRLYVFDRDSGAYLFDLFGAYITSDPRMNPSDL